jgi:hypothetical protein
MTVYQAAISSFVGVSLPPNTPVGVSFVEERKEWSTPAKAKVHLKLQRSLFTTTKAWVFNFLDRANDQVLLTLAVSL